MIAKVRRYKWYFYFSKFQKAIEMKKVAKIFCCYLPPNIRVKQYSKHSKSTLCVCFLPYIYKDQLPLDGQ